ncbi:MAG: hypothetical protein ACREHG_10730 [Candidatus Saccharimonadales bacterium]
MCKRSSIRTGRTLHCCLGVLCELAIAAGVPVERTVSNWQTEVSFDGEAGTLPASVRHWAGLTDSDPIVGNGPATLAGLNDDMLVGFAEIATIIEGGL